MAARAYQAFVSYAHADAQQGERLHRRLESYQVPKGLRGYTGGAAKLGRFFRDREELSAGPDLPEKIAAALRHSQALVVLCSPRAAVSRWVAQEITMFREIHPNGRVVAVVVDGEPPGCFPAPLRATEHLAADFRDVGDGLEDGFLKLVAGLIDAPFGEVKDRERQAERQRARRRNALVTTFGLLLVLALGGLAGTWLYSRRSNELALAAIESSGEISDKAFQIIMTTDTDPSAMEQLLNFSEAKLSDLEHYGVQLDELKSRRAWVLVRFAHFFAMVKQPQKSAEYAQRAIEMARQGSSFQTQLTVNSARSALAQAKFELSDLDNAFSEASRTVEEAQSLKSSFPSEYQATVAESEDLLLLGNIQAARKNWSEASAAHITAIARLDELLGLFPDSATFPMRKAENYEALTEIASNTSDTASAARYSLEAARSRMSFLKQNVGRRAHHQKMLEVALVASEANQRSGNPGGAVEAMELARQSMILLVEKEPDDQGARQNLERAASMLVTLKNGGNPFHGSPVVSAETGTLKASNPTLEALRDRYERAQALAETDHAAGLAELEAVTGELGRLHKPGAEDRETAAFYAEAAMITGSIAVDLGDKVKGETYLQAAKTTYDALSAADPSDARWRSGSDIALSAIENFVRNSPPPSDVNSQAGVFDAAPAQAPASAVVGADYPQASADPPAGSDVAADQVPAGQGAAVSTAALPAIDDPAADVQKITDIQAGLERAGCLHRSPTGHWGKLTREAMAEFNERTGSTLATDGSSEEASSVLSQVQNTVCASQTCDASRDIGCTSR